MICDEPVSALDVSVQAQVLNLLEDLKARHGLSLLFIAHDLAVVKNISDRIAVMYLGKLCEVAAERGALRRPGPPVHEGPARLGSGRRSDRVAGRRSRSAGEPPSAVFARAAEPPGCRFAPRCPRATDICADVEPTARARRRATDHAATSSPATTR